MPVEQRVRVPHLRDGIIVAKVGIERSSTTTARSSTATARNSAATARISTAFLAIAATLGLILYRFPPERYPFYPRCPIHEYLHIECPGCGATRALSAMLHGHFSAALHFNAFIVLILLPLAAMYAVICLNRFRKDGVFRWHPIPNFASISVVVLAASFTLFRNL